MIHDDEVLERLNSPVRQLTAQVEIRGDGADYYYSNAATRNHIAVSGAYPQAMPIELQFEKVNLYPFGDVETDGTAPIEVEFSLPAGTYYFSADITNANNSRYNQIRFILDGGVAKSVGLGIVDGRCNHKLVLATPLKAIRYGVNNTGNAESYKNIMISKFSYKAYAPYIEAPLNTMQVSRYGGNLCSIGSIQLEEEAELENETTLPQGTYTLTAAISSTDTEAEENMFSVIYTD
jgi:hypothetical protein